LSEQTPSHPWSVGSEAKGSPLLRQTSHTSPELPQPSPFHPLELSEGLQSVLWSNLQLLPLFEGLSVSICQMGGLGRQPFRVLKFGRSQQDLALEEHVGFGSSGRNKEAQIGRVPTWYLLLAPVSLRSQLQEEAVLPNGRPGVP
jgi:hypothetical protein